MPWGNYLKYAWSDLKSLKTPSQKIDYKNSKPPPRKEGSFSNEKKFGFSPKHINTLNICSATEYLKEIYWRKAE